MADIGSHKYRNVFDDANEFSKLQDLILGAVQDFSDYRKGNLTYGEIMFVMECILDSMRGTSEKEARGHVIGGLKDPSFATLMNIASRLVEVMVKKGVIGSAEEAYVLHGER